MKFLVPKITRQNAFVRRHLDHERRVIDRSIELVSLL
jgi:hypothetical protein